MADIEQPHGGAPAPGYGGPPPPPGPPGPPPPAFDARAARAQAKAEKARAKAMRPWYRKKRWWALGILVLVIGIVAASGGGEDDEPTDRTAGPEAATTAGPMTTAAPAGEPDATTAPTTAAPTTTAPSSGDGQETFAIGETAHTGDLDVVVHAVEDPFTPANQFEPAAQEGHRYVAVEAQLTNTTDEPVPFSSGLGAEMTDHLDRAWTVTLAGLDRPQLDGDVPPGGSRRGWMVFQVADDATDLHVRIKGNLTATGSLFALS